MRSLGPTSSELAWALGRQVAAFQEDLIVAFTHVAFGTVRQRVARHLLDMAVRWRHDLHVAMSQQTLADAVGTTREVTARALADLHRPPLRNRVVFITGGGRGVAAAYVRAVIDRRRRLLFDRPSAVAVHLPEVGAAIGERVMRSAIARLPSP